MAPSFLSATTTLQVVSALAQHSHAHIRTRRTFDFRNAAANIYNKDLDARNYGVGGFLKVYLYDYDALEPFTDVKIRTNAERVEGEEDVPEWYFEDGVVFLPEEIEVGLQLPEREHRRMFRRSHGDLLSVEYWQGVQDALAAGHVPGIRIYPRSCDLRDAPVEHDA